LPNSLCSEFFLALATYLDFEIHQVNIVAVYLQGDLDEEIYMEVPKGVKCFGLGSHYWKLKKALYGLKQVGRQWKKQLHDVFTKFNLTCTFADDCLYIKKKAEKIILIILIYVDNMAVAGPNGTHIVLFKSALAENFDITDMGELRFMLGILVTHDHEKRLIYLSQSAYIHQILNRFGMRDTIPVFTPLAIKHNLSTSQSPTSKGEKHVYKGYSDGIHYLSLVGSLLFTTQTRPDI